MHNISHHWLRHVTAGAMAAILAVAITTSAGISVYADLLEDSQVESTLERTDQPSDTPPSPNDNHTLPADNANITPNADTESARNGNETPVLVANTDQTATEGEASQEQGTANDTGGSDDTPIMPVAETTGVDMNGYLTGLSFARLENKVWVTTDTFTTDDQVKGSIRFAEVPTEEIRRSGNKIYVDLPAYIDCSGLEGKSYVTKDENNNPSGSYVIEEQADGTYRIVLTLDESYVNNAGATIGGNLEFEFLWDRDHVPDEGLHKVEIGNTSADITITKTDSGEDTKQNHYSLKKSAGDLRYSGDGKKAYIDYTVTLTVKDEVTGPITMHDVLSGDILTYTGAVQVDSKDAAAAGAVAASFENQRETETDIVVTATGERIPKGEYQITYTAETTVDMSDAGAALPDAVGNKVTLEDDKSNHTATTQTKLTKGTITKKGELDKTATDGKYIDYTVTLNKGDVVQNLTEGAVFSDVLPEEVVLDGDVHVARYMPDGTLVDTCHAGVDGQTISYTTPTGQYYYVITYRVRVRDDALHLGETTITNTATSSGGLVGTKSADVDVTNHVLDKSCVMTKPTPVQGGEGNYTATIRWQTETDVAGSLSGYVYEDWAALVKDKSGGYICPLLMTSEQREGIVVTNADGVVSADLYEVTESTHSDKKDKQTVENGLFVLTFHEGVTGPVIITYETTADLSSFKENTNLQFENDASLTKDGHQDTDNAKTDKFKYGGEDKNLIHKYGAESAKDASKDVTVAAGEDAVQWTIVLNEGKSLTTDLEMTDTIAGGMTYLPETLQITCNKNDITGADGVETAFDETTGTLTIRIAAAVYERKGKSDTYPVTITYKTRLPETFTSGGDKTLTVSNTASLVAGEDSADSTFRQNVTRNVLAKSGNYADNVLTYNVVVNSAGATLNDGKSLTVVDALTTKDNSNKSLLQYVQLESLQLFRAETRTDASGKVSIVPGKYLCDLTRVESAGVGGDADTGSGNAGSGAGSGTCADYTYTCVTNVDKKGVPTNVQFQTWLPDGVPYVIVARYRVTADIKGPIKLSNSVSMTGENSWSAKDDDSAISNSTGGSIYTGKNTLVVTKRDAEHYETVLSGAMFRLESCAAGDDGIWRLTEVATLTSGENGKTSAKEFEYDTLYRLTETAAPTDYVVNDEAVYYIAVQSGTVTETGDPVTESSVRATLPETVAGDSAYSRAAVKVYIVDKTKGASVALDWYDEEISYVLPDTGGAGTWPWMLAGAAMMIYSVVRRTRSA